MKARYKIGIGPVTDNTLYWENGEWKNTAGEIISAAGEAFNGVYSWSDYASVAGNIWGLRDRSNKKIYPGDVHIGFGQTHYYLNSNGWYLR